MNQEARYQELSDEQLELVHVMCESYERAIRRELPTLEGQLRLAPFDLQDVIFRESLAIELELRRTEGEFPQANEYTRRFPDREQDVRAVFAEVTSGDTSRLLHSTRRATKTVAQNTSPPASSDTATSANEEDTDNWVSAKDNSPDPG